MWINSCNHAHCTRMSGFLHINSVAFLAHVPGIRLLAASKLNLASWRISHKRRGSEACIINRTLHPRLAATSVRYVVDPCSYWLSSWMKALFLGYNQTPRNLVHSIEGVQPPQYTQPYYTMLSRPVIFTLQTSTNR